MHPGTTATAFSRAAAAGLGGEGKWELIDQKRQVGPMSSREALAKEIFRMGGGFAPEELHDATRSELLLLNSFLGRFDGQMYDFRRHVGVVGSSLLRARKTPAQMSIGELYKVRVAPRSWTDLGSGNWITHQNDADDMRVTLAFRRFLLERLSSPRRRSDGIFRGMLHRVDRLLLAAAPAYGVTLTPDEVADPIALTSKFANLRTRGTFQFAATYLLSLKLDFESLQSAIRSTLG